MNTSFEQTIERLVIDAEIRDLTARFSDAVNRRDPDASGDLFADDGAWEIGEPTPSKYSWTTDGVPQSSTPFRLDLRGSVRLRRGARGNLYHRARPTPARRPALIQTPVPHLTCPVAFPSAPEQTRPDSSQASGRSFAADAPSPSRPG